MTPRRPVRVPPVAVCVAAGVAQRAFGRGGRPHPIAASALAAASAGVLVAPVVAFRRHGTTVDPRAGARPAALVTGGVNAITRNPMYVGMAGLLTAQAVARGRVAALLPVVAFVGWIDRVQIEAEERELAATFGPSYDSYRRSVPRWLGRR
ncbi:MAG TPA: isoprenylcysteine carboxylmethyltransferase family protein [Nocardioides sp.]|uniref:methyltransferase family protein n=1 Tax=Nocardioides sp. TaxID=35761 RepID=UPI002C4BF8FE|nr:isoprenylcysteine carboxylmethyltransferase family protein [Nocardioides sp.]HTW13961.1 isoprenylcysteine carboxylmethyltransferase family protein [Nocardioides sp.]